MIQKSQAILNDDITATEVLLIDENGISLGVKTIDEARDIAYSGGLDIVLLSSNEKQSTCKVMDYNKFCFKQAKKQKETKKNHNTNTVKEIQLSYRIDKHDFETKVKNARNFLKENHNVLVVLRLKGRENCFAERALVVANGFYEACSDICTLSNSIEKKNNSILFTMLPLSTDTKNDATDTKGAK